MPPTGQTAAFARVDRRHETDLPELLLDALPRTMVVIRDVVRRFARGDRTMLHFRVVTQLLDEQRTTSELAELTGATPANISKVIAHMARAQLVTRSHDAQDRRYVHIALTSTGRAQAVAMLAAVRAELGVRLAVLSRGQRQILAEGMGCLADAFGPAAEPERQQA